MKLEIIGKNKDKLTKKVEEKKEEEQQRQIEETQETVEDTRIQELEKEAPVV